MDRKDVINKVFPHSLFGYDPIAVDAFLDEVIREFDRLNNSIDVLQFRLAHELGDAYHQNDVLSRELEFARFGRRVNELLSAGGDNLLPEAALCDEPEAEASPAAAARPAPPVGRAFDPDEVQTEDRSFDPDNVQTEDRSVYPD